MFGGAYYIWIMLAFAIGCGGLGFLFITILLIGHWLEKKETGASHRFLELPQELRPEKSDQQSPPGEPPA
jgi:hypothetical protein